jgi:glycosyltransferase involved in cell wall biosynthesis
MKIVLFIFSMHSGGAERVSANLANAWAEQGHDVTVLTLASADLDFYELRLGVKRVALDLAGNSSGPFTALWANLQRVLALRRVFREIRPDVVLAMMTTAAVLAILATRGMTCRVLVSERTYPPLLPVGRMWDRLRRWTYPLANQVVMLTSEGLTWLHACIPGARGTVIPNPVSYPLAATAPWLEPETYITSGRKVLLAVGRLDEGKQFDRLLDAFAMVAARYPLWDLVILGEGPARDFLEQRVQQLELAKRVVLPGRAGNIGDWYVRADLYVMSSRFEGFPNSLAEAMAHGCAAVSYDCETGPRDIIRHEQDGLLVTPVGDAAALATALGTLMGDEVKRKNMAGRAEEVRTRYSMSSILTIWEKLLLETK